ncbi:MAG: hypothetical protein CVU44_17290 [Chloroflexi bacterium HGW-Chloroflexi-6]|nr:MAG: hypothetical protein CVU44_17290 [Chloroflexi bacterium HGW-Chloroflexi-6]
MNNQTTWSAVRDLQNSEFQELCKSILNGLGFLGTEEFPVVGLDLSYLDNITRESTDKLFRSEESWLIGFLRQEFDPNSFQELIKNIKSTGVENFFFVVFGDVPEKYQIQMHNDLLKDSVKSSILVDELSCILIADYGKDYLETLPTVSLSIRTLREKAIKQAKDATWRTQFQTLSALAPTKITSTEGGDEADLFRAMSKTGSFLLLGDPGGGKTTSLKVMAEQLSEKGGRTPIYMPLNQYTGELLSDIGRFINDNNPMAPEFIRHLLETGAFTLMLDGLNEVHPNNLQTKIRDDLFSLTNPKSATSRTQWIVSGRKYDYAYSRKLVGLEFLENNIWEIQPLTPDLIYQYLRDGLEGGEEEALSVYHSLDSSVMEICATPLMLNMLFAVYKSKKTVPTGKGKLYGQFIDLLLNWGEEKYTENILVLLSSGLGYEVNKEKYFELIFSSLQNLAKDMSSTSAPWEEVSTVFVQTLASARDPYRIAEYMRQDLISRGILKLESRRISFFHHTFQEYFQALNLKGVPIDILIPSKGVDGEKREQLVFLVGIVENLANPLLSRAINIDVDLAYDIFRNSLSLIEKGLLIKLANSIWEKTLNHSKGWVGGGKPYAVKFKNIAENINLPIEQLAKEMLPNRNKRAFSKELLGFFQELGDITEQRRILKEIEGEVGESIPDDFLFEMAITASTEGKYEKVVELYSRFIQKSPNSSAAYANRANAYNALGKRLEAQEDFEKSIKLDPKDKVARTNYARMLKNMGEIEKAIVQLSEAVKEKVYAAAHFEYGLLLEAKKPDEALAYFENAVSTAEDSSALERYTRKLVEQQEKQSQFSQAIRSYKRLIQLSPTSHQVKKWKESIASLRLQIDAIERRRSTRDRIREKEEILLGIFSKDFLSAAGLETKILLPQLFLTDGSKARLPIQLAVALLETPELTASQVRDAVDAVNTHLPFAADIILITSADVLDFDARMQLLTYRRSDKRVALITSVEAQEAFLRGDDACVELMDRALRRSIDISDPFERKVPIKDRTDFFGRDTETQNIRFLIRDQQPFGLFGIHKIGKSSLLNRVCQSLAAYSPDITFVSIELSAAFNNSSSIYKRIMELLPQEVEVPYGEITTDKFRAILIEYQKQMQSKRSGHRFLVIFDECAYLIPDRSGKGGLTDFLGFIGFLKSFRQEVDWFNFILCGRSPAISRISHWAQGENPLIGFTKDIFLGPLTPKETNELVTSLGIIAGLLFDEKSTEYIYSITGGHPLFTRILGSQIKKIFNNGNVTTSIIDDAVELYLDNNSERALLVKIYNESLDEEEREVVRKLVNGKALRRSELLSQYADDEKKRRIRDAINNLKDTTVIRQDNDNQELSIRYELLRRAIEQEIKELG